MTITVRLPDGSDVDVPTDDPKQATAAAQKHWASKQAPKPAAEPKAQPKRTVLQTIGDFSNNMLDNVLPNWGDEVYATGGALRGLVDGKDVGESFRASQRQFKQHQDQYRAEHPKLNVASAAAGMGLGLAAPVGRVAEGASMAARMAHGAAVGAGYGAVSGAGEGDGLAERGENAVRSGAIGAGMGAMATPLVTGAVRAGRMARMYTPGLDTAARRLANVPRAVMRRPLVGPGQQAVEQADRMVGRNMREGNIQTGMGQTGAAASPEAITAELNRRQAMGVPAMPADTTEAMRNLTSWSSRGMGPGQTRVREALDARKATEAARVRQHVGDTFGPAVDPELAVEQHIQSAKDAVAPLYREAYNQPMVVTPEIQGIMQTPAFQDALPHAIRNIRNAQRNPTELGFRLDGNGNITGDQVLTAEGYDQVIRAMRDSGQAAMRPPTVPGGRPSNTTDSVNINNRARDLGQHLGDQNEAYREATERYGSDMAQRDAFRNGQDVAKLTGSEIGAQARSMPEAAQPAWALGARTAMADQASQFGAKYPTGDTAAALRKTLGDDAKQEAIGQMTGNTGAVRGLQDRLEAEHQSNIVWKEVQGNSRTASRLASDQDLDAAIGSGPSSFSVKGVLSGVIRHIADRAQSQYRNDVKARIAQIVTETNPATVQDLMAAIADRAQRDREFASLLHRSGIIAAKAAGANVVPERSDDE